jgi:Tfp pilus assembly protein PilO
MVENKVTKSKYFFSTTVFVVTGVAAVALFFVVILPFFNKAQELTAETKIKQTELKKLEDKKAKLEELKTREEELKKEAETVRNALPEQKDVGRLFIQLDNMAITSGGEIKSVTEGGSNGVAQAATTTNVGSSETGIQKVKYAIPIEFRNYSGIKDFVTKTESALRICGIDDFSIMVSQDANGLTTSFNTTTFVRN